MAQLAIGKCSTMLTLSLFSDTSFLVQNGDDLLKTEKTFCWSKQGAEQNLAMSLPRTALLSKMFYEKSDFKPDQTEERSIFGDKCLIERSLKGSSLVGKSNSLMVLSRTETNAYLLIFAQVYTIKKGWILLKGE